MAILTNAGGPGILAADACEANGLELVQLSEVTRGELRSFLPEAASITNPVDMLASAPAEHYRRALAALLKDQNVDSILTIFIPPLVTDADAVAAAVVAAAAEADHKPIAGIFMRSAGAPPALAPVPCYAFPEAAAIALARATTYGEWQRKPAGIIPAYPDIRSAELREIVEEVLVRGGGWLTPDQAQAVLAATGIQTARAKRAGNVDEAVAAASLVGFPVALKALGPTLLHKTERQAVQLNLPDASAVRKAAADFERRFAGELTGLLIQRMVPGGVEMLVGAVNDSTFGPLLVCGTGGVLVDLLNDSVFRMHPLSTEDATEMIGELRGARLLRGYRGAEPVDEAALREVLLRVSTLVAICPEIQELDLNPIKILTAGACALDARIRIERQAPRPRTRRVEY